MNRTKQESPIKNCNTCAHQTANGINGARDRCVLHGYYCQIARQAPAACRLERDWVQRPPEPDPIPRRSFRQWIYDTFWKWSVILLLLLTGCASYRTPNTHTILPGNHGPLTIIDGNTTIRIEWHDGEAAARTRWRGAERVTRTLIQGGVVGSSIPKL